jgi:DNA-binding NarL/FixJ family response regulator
MDTLSEEQTIEVVIIEDDETIRNGYALLIGANPLYRVVNVYASADEALLHLAADDPQAIILDIELPGTGGIEAIPKIKRLLPDVHILILTVYESERIILSALSGGADGYLTKNTSPGKIMEAIEDVVRGGGPMSASIARLVVRSFQRNPETPLTRRETEILEYVYNGLSRARIARDLFIDVETVKTHIKNIYFKLNVHSRADAIRTAKLNKFIR